MPRFILSVDVDDDDASRLLAELAAARSEVDGVTVETSGGRFTVDLASYATPDNETDLLAALRSCQVAAEGQSNDDEIGALSIALEAALGMLGRSWPDTDAPAEPPAG